MLKTAISIEITMKPTTSPMIRIIAGSRRRVRRLTSLRTSRSKKSAVVMQHLVELAGVLADRDHLQRELRKHPAPAERSGHAGAFAHADLHLARAPAR